jgi:hypothetical protein
LHRDANVVLPVPDGLMFVSFTASSRHAASDTTLADWGRHCSGPYLSFLLLLLIIVPVPHSFYKVVGLHCPYR